VQAFSSRLLQGRLTPDALATVNEPEEVSDFSSVLVLRQQVVDAGERGARLRSARADAARLHQLEAAARRDVRRAVIEAWDGVVQARSAIRLRASSVAVRQAHEELTSARFDEGVALESDLLSVRVGLDEAREVLASARRAEAVALARLSRAVGEPVGADDVPSEETAPVTYSREEEGVVEAARTAHPLVQAQAAAVEAARETLRAARRSSRPSLSAQVAGEWHGEDGGIGVERDSYAAALVVDLPVYDAGLRGARVAEASAALLEAEASRRDVQDALELAARTAHHAAVEATARLPLADAAVVAAESALAIVTERYRAGLMPVLDLLEAERALTQARTRVLDARARALSAMAAIESLAGTESDE
jgi:cobalt-zinc-cadmium efflux system outer membrane protein